MQTLEIGADTKSCRDISHLYKDYLVLNETLHFNIFTACGGLKQDCFYKDSLTPAFNKAN